MIRRDMVLGHDLQNALSLTDVTATSNGIEIDRQCFYAAKINVRAHDLNSGTFTAKLQESNTSGSGYTDVSADDTIVKGDQTASTVVFADTEDDTIKQLGYIGLKRYIRVVITAATPVGVNNFSADAEQMEDFANAL
jgi:hypothetical protein